MAQYDANINVNVNAKQAEAQLTKLQQSLDKLSRTSANISVTGAERGLQNFKQTASKVGTEVKNIFSRGLFAGAILGAGQLGTSLAAATSHLGPFTGAVKAAGAAFSSSLGGAPALIGNILNQIGHIPNAMGLAAIAAMAFAPQLLKASSAAVGLGAAIDKAVGPKAISGIAGFAEKLTSVEQEFKRIAAPMELLREELNLATKEFDKYVAFTNESVTAAQQLLAVERRVTAEKRAQNTLLTQLDPFASRRIGLQQRIARIRRGEEGGTAGFREFMGRQTAIGAGAERARLQNEARTRRFAAAGISPGTQYPGEIGPGPASEVALSTQLRGRLQQLVQERKRNTEAIRETVRENIRESQVARQAREDSLAAIRLRNQEIRLQRQLERRGLQQLTTGAVAPGITAGFGIQGPALPPRAARPAAGGGRSRLSGVVSNAVIGGAFPLLFGQGGGAATGGAIGGLLGGAFGGAGGFAGSLLGTLLGQIAGQAGQVKELAADIGFSAQQTQLLATAFKQAGADFDKFQESVSRIQGLGLALEEQASAIQLASTLTENFGGKIDKVTNAFTNALQTGKVTQATLNQLTSQSIPIQEALAAKYNVSRSALLQMAKDGKISVQDLIDTLINLAEESTKGPTQTSNAYREAFDQISLAVDNLAKKVIESFKFQSDEASKTGENLAYRVSGAFTQIISAIEPVVTLLATTSGAFVNLGVQAIDALSGIPNLVSTVANSIIGLIPGLGSVYTTLSLISNLRGNGGRKPGIATPLNLNQGMNQNWPEGISRPGTVPSIGTITAPSQLEPSGKRGKADRGARDVAREAERVAKLLRDTRAETELLGIQAELQDRIFKAEQDKNPILVARLKGEKDILDIQFKYANLLANEPNIRAQEALVAKGLQEIENSRLQTAQAFEKIETDRKTRVEELLTNLERELELNSIKDETAKKLKQIEFDIIDLRKQGILLTEQEIEAYRQRAQAVATAADKLTGQQKMEQELFEGLASTFAGTVTSAFDAAVSGTENFGVALQELGGKLLSTIGQMLIMYSIAQALGALGGGAGNPQGILSFLARAFGYQGKANGGPVAGATPYLVGERGPELFVPGTSGGVMSNNDLRQSMNGGGSPVLNMSFETTRFGDTEYVSRDQLEAAMSETRRQASRDGAQRGMTMTLDRLQQSPRTRSRLGMR